MVTSRQGAVIASVAAVAFTCAAVAAQQQARDTRREQTGSASISGVVVTAGEARRPLAWAAVTVVSQTPAAQRMVVTDDAGRFTIDGLAAGQFALSASKPAYLTMNYGATKPERQGTSIALGDGQALTGLTIALPKGAAVAGAIFDAAGAPFPNAAVSVLRWQMLDGERTYVAVQSLTSDMRGQYRAFGLVPGEYVVSADASTGELMDVAYEFFSLSDSEIGAALTRARRGGAADVAAAPMARRKSVGYAQVFYPGTTDASRAQRVALSAGEEKDGLDLRLELAPMARVDGTVTSPTGPVPAGLRVSLTPLGPAVENFRFVSSGGLGPKTIDTDGRFLYTGVPPGDYTLIVMPRPAPAPAGRGAPAPEAADAPFAYARISVTGEDQRVTLTLEPGMVVAGRVAFDGAAPASVVPSIALKDVHIEPPGIQRTRQETMAADGSFRIGGLGPGRFIFGATVPGGAWVPASAIANGRDWLDAPFDLKPGDRITDLVVTMTDRPSGLSGRLLGSSGTITSDYFVIVFSDDRGFWFPNSRRIVSVRPSTDGRYVVPNLPPGRYRIAAVTDIEIGEWFESSFLDSLMPLSVAVSLDAHERKVQDLRITR